MKCADPAEYIGSQGRHAFVFAQRAISFRADVLCSRSKLDESNYVVRDKTLAEGEFSAEGVVWQSEHSWGGGLVPACNLAAAPSLQGHPVTLARFVSCSYILQACLEQHAVA